MRYITRAPVPIDALRLNEDIRSLEHAQRILKTVDACNTAEDTPGQEMLWFLIGKLKGMQRHAEHKMRTTFLAPQRKRMNDVQRRVV